MAAQSDADLMARIRSGDDRAFETLYACYGDAIHRHATRITRSSSAADDLVQEVFLRLWTRADQWRGEGSVRGWLLSIATNLALNYLRSVRRRPQRPLESVVDAAAGEEESAAPGWMVDASLLGPDAIVEAAEQRDFLQRRISALPEEKREVFRMVHEDEMSIRDVADALRIPEGTVKSRLHYARARLAREWRELEEEWRNAL